MKFRVFGSLLTVVMLLTLVVNGCDQLTGNDEDAHSKLDVVFQNDNDSQFSIISLELRPMGAVEDTSAVPGEWSDNILPEGTRLAPGDTLAFVADIPNLHWSQYRVTVDAGNGVPYRIDNDYPPITHWGSDKRRVRVYIREREDGTPAIAGWGEWAE